jgi:hypothetical protein
MRTYVINGSERPDLTLLLHGAILRVHACSVVLHRQGGAGQRCSDAYPESYFFD